MPKKALIADDDAALRSLVAAVLALDFDQVIEAAGGVEARSAAQQEVPDLVLLDVNMPTLDGLEVCRQLRSVPAFAQVPIVMLTARDTQSEVRDGFAAGASDYMVKPFSSSQLRARVRTWLLRQPS